MIIYKLKVVIEKDIMDFYMKRNRDIYFLNHMISTHPKNKIPS